jgi:hypothetical protein
MNLTFPAAVVLLLLSAGCSTPGQPNAPGSSGPGGPVTEIPADLRLPHEDAWSATGPGGSVSPLPGVCVDPPPELADASPTDGRGVQDLGAPGSPTEALGVWAGVGEAAEAVRDWRGEVARCGGRGPHSHSGFLVEWTVASADVRRADESWVAYERNLDPDVPPGEVVDLFYVVARVGNAVYVEGAFVPGGLDQDLIATYTRSGSQSVSAFLSKLAIFSDH